ncbi:MAG: efflux RND transporter periplasmic adaptor subunit, partial [Spirochaetes bacterium]|nr:efflux RND transporter periplasmic adaptor subunit [Spirochaetota bacterium]
ENQRKLTLAQIQVQEAVINVQKAELNLKRAERSQQETQALHALGAASDEQLLTSTENLESARQAFRLSELAREKAGLVLEEAHYNVEAAKVRAPVAGTILSVESSAGAYVSANASVALVGDLSRLRMSAEVDEYDIMRLSSGLQVKIESDSAAIGTLTARLDQISPVAKIVNNISFFSVSALVANSEGLLRPGMTADMSIIIARDQGLTVPSNALTTIRGRSYLDVLVDGVPETRRVEAGADDGKRIVILSGLEEQDQVVLPQAASLPGLIPVATTTDKASTLIPVSIPGSGGGGSQ